MGRPDILIYMSDQHAPQYMGGGKIEVDTPNLDKLQHDGTSFSNAYTACPLCVPARMSMLTGMRASHTNIFTNNDTLSSTLPTFLHNLVSAGYETVLAGRMHFVGVDQRHGFTKRIAPDFTNSGSVRPPWMGKDFGVHSNTMGYKWCTHVVGGGESPVQYYDKMVVNATIEYLKQKHEKPQFILVGTYAPHFPYVAPKDLFYKYLEKAKLPDNFKKQESILNPVLKSLQEENVRPEVLIACQAAYRGMIEFMDGMIGCVRSAFEEFVNRRKTKSVFGYLSDHGDTIGEHGIFGKKTFFENSSSIPMIFAGDGILKNKEWKEPVSILDLGPTLCDLVNTSKPYYGDGESLADILRGHEEHKDRIVLCESMDKNPEGRWTYGRMARQGRYKFITYRGYEDQDMLFDVEGDWTEQNNLADELPDICAKFRIYIESETNADKIEKRQAEHELINMLFADYERAIGFDDRERFRDFPEQAKLPPEVCVTTLNSKPGISQTSRFIGLPKVPKET